MQSLRHWETLNRRREAAPVIIPNVDARYTELARPPRLPHSQPIHTLLLANQRAAQSLNAAIPVRSIVSQALNNSSNRAAASSSASRNHARHHQPLTINHTDDHRHHHSAANHLIPPSSAPTSSDEQQNLTLHTSSSAGGAIMPTVIALIINETDQSTQLQQQQQQQQRMVAILGVLVVAFLSALGYPDHHKESLRPISHNKAKSSTSTDVVSETSSDSPVGTTKNTRVQSVGMIPAVSIDSLRRGRLVENGCVYRQTFVIRSYEVGFDRTASIETLANLFQETALNHVGMADFVGDGMGTTHAMMRSRLIWVVTKMHIEAVDYPVWGDVVEIDSWVSGSGKNGMRRDFLVRDYLTGHIRARATSHWAMMNQDTRRLSKMPDDVRAEISPYFIDRSVMINSENQKAESELYSCQRITKLDDSAPYIKSGLAPRLHDMDMNQHVNHVKYISWVLESVPQTFLVAHELMGMTLEYRRECNHSDVLASLTSPDNLNDLAGHHASIPIKVQGSNQPISGINGHNVINTATSAQYSTSNICNLSSKSADDNVVNNTNNIADTKHSVINGSKPAMIHFTHLLRLQDGMTEILRGRTSWRLKKQRSASSTHRVHS